MPTTYGASTILLAIDSSVGGIVLDNLGHQDGSLLQDPWLVLVEFWPDVYDPNIVLHMFSASHIHLIQMNM